MEKDCADCGLPTDRGARFCGNCGRPLIADKLTLLSATPEYAHAEPASHRGEIQAVLAVACAVIGIAGALIAPLFGILLGLAGVVFGTVSWHAKHKITSVSGIAIGSVAALASVGVWVYTVAGQHAQTQASAQVANANAVASSNATTPCYQVDFVQPLNVVTASDSCDMQAYDGQSLTTSSNAYKVYGYHQPSVTASNFAGFAKQALEKDVGDNLTGYTLDSSGIGQFAGSTAYQVRALSADKKVTYIEAAVLHPGAKDNVYVFVHAATGDGVSLQNLESAWQWK